jgi:hypothetical protein
MAGVQGLQGLTPAVTPAAVTNPGATAPQIHGGPVNPAHAAWEWDTPVPWAVQQGLDLSGQGPTVEGSLISQVPAGAPAGSDPDGYADPTATLSHGAPWPSAHIPDSGAVNNAAAAAEQSIANMALHSIDSGDPAAFTTQPVPGHKMPWNLSPDFNSQGAERGPDVGDLTGNNRTGWERFNGWAVPDENLNAHGFDQAHVHRQNPAGEVPVPLNTTQGAQRPLVMNVPGRYEYPTGPGSPFAGQVPGVGNDYGAAEIGVASDYAPPPDSPTNPVLAAPAGDPAWGLEGVF